LDTFACQRKDNTNDVVEAIRADFKYNSSKCGKNISPSDS